MFDPPGSDCITIEPLDEVSVNLNCGATAATTKFAPGLVVPMPSFPGLLIIKFLLLPTIISPASARTSVTPSISNPILRSSGSVEKRLRVSAAEVSFKSA